MTETPLPDRTPPEGDDTGGHGTLIAARICHDLTGPLGAIDNGVELLGLRSRQTSPELDLIAQSVAHAKARLRVLRLAFGPTEAGQIVTESDLRMLVADMQKFSHLRIDSRVIETQPRDRVKAALLLLLCVDSTLPRGAQATLANAGPDWMILAEALSGKPRDLVAYWQAMEADRPMPEASPALIHFAVAREALAQQGRRLQAIFGRGRLRLEF